MIIIVSSVVAGLSLITLGVWLLIRRHNKRHSHLHSTPSPFASTNNLVQAHPEIFGGPAIRTAQPLSDSATTFENLSVGSSLELGMSSTKTGPAQMTQMQAVGGRIGTVGVGPGNRI